MFSTSGLSVFNGVRIKDAVWGTKSNPLLPGSYIPRVHCFLSSVSLPPIDYPICGLSHRILHLDSCFKWGRGKREWSRGVSADFELESRCVWNVDISCSSQWMQHFYAVAKSDYQYPGLCLWLCLAHHRRNYPAVIPQTGLSRNVEYSLSLACIFLSMSDCYITDEQW